MPVIAPANPPKIVPKIKATKQVITIIFVIVGYDPNSGIMGTLVKTTFSGLSVLFPTTIAVLYWNKATKIGCIASIIIGEISVGLFYLEILPSFGLLPAIWSVFISAVILILLSLIQKQPKKL